MLWNSRACIVVVIETRPRIVSILQPKPPYMYIEDWCRRIGQLVSSWKEKRGICDTRMAVCPSKWFKGLTYQMGYKKHNRPPWPSNPYLAMVYGARTRLETSQKDLQLMQKGDVEETTPCRMLSFHACKKMRVGVAEDVNWVDHPRYNWASWLVGF